jgi:hypothetical protein
MPHIEFVNNVLVQNSISAISGIYADTLNAKSGISSPDVNLLKSTSGTWDSVYTTVSTNSADWQSTYTTFKNTSGSFLTTETDSQTLSYDEGLKELSISNGNSISLSSVNNELNSLSGNWENTYNTVSSNSADWSYQGTDIKGLTGNWESTYTTFKNTSASFLTTETDSQTLTYNESNAELSISNANTISLSSLDVRALSSNWQNTYTTVQANSSAWILSGSDVSGISGNWESTYTTVSTHSAQWNSSYSTVSSNSASWSANPQVVEATVFNADSVNLVRGNVVYSFGATGDTMSVKLASNSGEATSSKTLGFVNDTIVPGGTGTVTIVGRMDNLNFGAPYVDGDALWLGNTPGTYTRTKPTAPDHGVYLGVVERANSGNGIAYVKVQNGYELYEIHDVAITTPLSGQMLRRNSANTLWINTDDGTKWDSTYTIVNAKSANWDTSSSRTFGSEYSFHEQFLNNTSLGGNLLIGTTTGGSITVATSGIFGQAQLSTGANATAGSNVRIQSGANQFNVIGNGALDYAIRFNQSSSVWFDGTLLGAFRAGLMTSFNTDSTGIYFRVVNGSALQFVSRSGGSETVLTLESNITQGPFHLCQFSINSAGTSITVKYNGSVVGTVTTNIPTAGLFHNICLIRESSTGTAVTASLDFVAMRYIPNTAFFSF